MRYPHLKFSKHWYLDHHTMYLLGGCGAIVDAICRIPLQPEYRDGLLRVSLIQGAQATTAIEGNTLTESEVRQVAAGKPLARSKEYQEREVKNILDAMNELIGAVAVDGIGNVITPDLIRRFHAAVGKELGEHFDAIPGRFRTDNRVVGPYKCPRPEDVEELVSRLCRWLPDEFGFATNQQTFPQAVVQAIVTHVYLEWIHPFGDGNGRTGRLLEFYILLRGGNPDIASHILSNFYNQTRPEYYRQLHQANETRDLSAFIRYAVQGYYDGLTAVLEALSDNSVKIAWRYLVHAKFAERPYRKKSVFKRRRRLALALPPDQALSPDEIIVLTPEIARDYAALTPRTLSRDLEELRVMEIVTEAKGKFRLNLGLLRPTDGRVPAGTQIRTSDARHVWRPAGFRADR
jgi:Fic family protein